jgi:hypothetical protein
MFRRLALHRAMGVYRLANEMMASSGWTLATEESRRMAEQIAFTQPFLAF